MCKNTEKSVNLLIMKGRIRVLCLLALALSCGTRGNKAAQTPALRDFPMADVPTMMTEPLERAVWLAQHFWDRFTDPQKLYTCDSLTVNGVSLEPLESQVGLFASLLQQIPLPEGEKAMVNAFRRLSAFQEAQPQGNVFSETSALISRYFFDPNSPVRSEDLYLPFVTLLASSPLTPEDLRPGYAWDVKTCQMNRTGTPAADFTFVDTAGRRRTLHGIKAEWTLLIFGNPDCGACRELMDAMQESAEISALLGQGRLQVVDVYIDEDIALWKERMKDYPAQWINGYDPTFSIRGDRLYAVRALPSLYLLDRDKTVVLKDAPEQTVLEVLARL